MSGLFKINRKIMHVFILGQVPAMSGYVINAAATF